MLTDKVEILEEVKHTHQNSVIEDDEGKNSGTASEAISTEPMIRAMAKEHVPNGINHKIINGKREEKEQEEDEEK